MTITMNSSAYEINLDLFIQYFRNPTIRDRSRSQLERIARELVEIRVRANETTLFSYSSYLMNTSVKCYLGSRIGCQ